MVLVVSELELVVDGPVVKELVAEEVTVSVE